MKIEGISAAYRMFPVGSSNELRWIALHNATGDFMITYTRGDGRLIDSRMVAIHHISGQEYWQVTPGITGGNASVELSFNDANQSGVTDLVSLKVARLKTDGWNDAGNLATTGSAGGRGSVISDLQFMPEPGGNTLFTMAAGNGSQNPLPVNSVRLHIEEQPDYAIINFDTTGLLRVQLQQRVAADSFVNVETKTTADWSTDAKQNSFKILKTASAMIFRLSCHRGNGNVLNSREILIHRRKVAAIDFNAVVQSSIVTLRIVAGKKMDGEILVFNISGQLLTKARLTLKEGIQIVTIQLPMIMEKQLVLTVIGGMSKQSKIVHVR